MQKALENQHYKKIWEQVMMNRHPEAKSLEEALKMEAYQDGCLFYNTKENMYGLNLAYKTLTRYTPFGLNILNNPLKRHTPLRADYGFCSHKNTEFTYQDEPSAWQYGYNFEILGRPITLEDLWLVHKPFQYFKLNSDGCFVDDYQDMGCRTKFTRFVWQLRKPLHEQTPQTWANIYTIITTDSYLYRSLV